MVRNFVMVAEAEREVRETDCFSLAFSLGLFHEEGGGGLNLMLPIIFEICLEIAVKVAFE